MGDALVVGLIPDSEIRRCKGPPVMSDEERHTMVESVKWVDEVITGDLATLPLFWHVQIPMLSSNSERHTMVQSVEWVDEVITGNSLPAAASVLC